MGIFLWGGGITFGGSNVGPIGCKQITLYNHRSAKFKTNITGSNRYPFFAVVTSQQTTTNSPVSVFAFVAESKSVIKICGNGSLTYDSSTDIWTLDSGTDQTWGSYMVFGIPSSLELFTVITQ